MSGPHPDRRKEAADRLHRLFAEEWEFRMRENPLYASHCGDHRFDDRLPEVSEQDIQRRAARSREFLSRLGGIPREDLSDGDRLHRDLFARELEEGIAEVAFRTHLIGLSRMGGVQKSFTYLPEFTRFETAEDYENYTARLRAFRRYAARHVELMRAGIAEGFTQPRAVVEGVEKTIQPHLVDRPEDSVFYRPFESLPGRIAPAERSRLAGAGRAAVAESVVPAYADILRFVEGEYLPAARQAIDASSLPEGRALYEHLVRKFTTLDLTPQEVHDTGRDQVRAIRQEMDAVIREAGFDGTFRQFVELLRTDPRFYAEKPEQLLKEAAWIAKRMDGELPRLFGHLPRMPYGLKPMPEHIAPDATTAYYSLPAGDFTRAGFYWLNTYDLKSRPLYELEALTLHEAVPGHHLQLALQLELKNLPAFRRHGGQTAFCEGWALYAESLGREAGFYTDPHSDFGRLTFRMWRACRLVVDTGIHYLGWARQRAVDFMAENTALSLLNVRNEVDRYIAWPGQAVSYMIGELTIRRLRAAAEERLGEGFDLRGFHQAVLEEGGIPLNVLEAKVTRWIGRAGEAGAGPRTHDKE